MGSLVLDSDVLAPTLSWSGLSRPSTSPLAPALAAQWILGTSPRMTHLPDPTNRAAALFPGAGKQQQVAVGVFDDEGVGAPGLLAERLEEGHPCGLELEEQ